jgi:hypothetical protein
MNLRLLSSLKGNQLLYTTNFNTHKKKAWTRIESTQKNGKKKARTHIESAQKKSLATTYSPTLLCAVPSAMKDLTSEFGMGSGVPLSLSSPSKRRKCL